MHSSTGVSESDEYIFLEDLEGEAARRFIDEANRELRRLLGSLPERYKPLLEKLLSRPTAYDLAAASDGVFVLYRGDLDYVSYVGSGGWRRIVRYSAGEELLRYIEPVRGLDGLAVHVSVAGSDEGVVDVVTPEGVRLWRVEGSAWSFAVVGGELYYVKFYRKKPSPDGGKPPVSRFVRLAGEGVEEVVWGSQLKPGKRLNARYLPEAGLIAYSVWEGWSRSWLYLADAGNPGEARLAVGGDAAYEPIGWLDGVIVVRRGVESDELLRCSPEGGVERLARLTAPVEAAEVLGDGVAVVHVEDYYNRIAFYDTAGRRRWVYEPPEPATITALSSSGDELYILETSFTTPYRIVRLDPSGASEVVEEPPYRLEDASIGEFWVRSRDGTLIHSWLVSPRRERPRAVLVYGYGGFGISLTPRYNPLLEILLAEGIAFVQANLRGGREHGEAWHRAGMLENKRRVFEDYAAVVEHLKSLGVKVVGWGASNGGLLIGAVETMWPNLLDAALIGYPVLDMLRFHKLYIGRVWVPEYGDPEDPRMRSYLLSYSPYHNIPKDKKLPPTLVYTGLHDDRVHPGHALKYAAKARKLGHPVYLRVETRSGHSGARPEVRAAEMADMLAFILTALNLPSRLATRS